MGIDGLLKENLVESLVCYTFNPPTSLKLKDALLVEGNFLDLLTSQKICYNVNLRSMLKSVR